MSGSGRANTTVSLTIQLRGNGADALRRAGADQLNTTRRVNQQFTQINTQQTRYLNVQRQSTQQMQQTARAGQNLLGSHQTLVNVLRREIEQQRTLVQQLRQAEQASQRIRQNAEQTANRWQKAKEFAGGIAAAGAGLAAGASVVSSSLETPRQYDELLTYITATATAGKNLTPQQRLQEKRTYDSYVRQAVRYGGGTREASAQALDKINSSGVIADKDYLENLKMSSKVAFATDAKGADAGQMTVSMTTFGVKDLQKGHDIAIKGGQLGSFEYKDLAKYLPQQMGSASNLGYSGEDGLIKLVALNQLAKRSASSSDDAGNNVVNLLAKLSSQDFAKAVAGAVELKNGDPIMQDGKKTVFDWNTYKVQQKKQGVDPIEAFMKLLDRQLKGNPEYQSAQSQLQSANTPASQKKALTELSNIALGNEIGQIIADQQVMMAALDAVYGKDRGKQIENALRNSAGTTNAESQMVRDTEFAKNIAAQQEVLFAQSRYYDAVAPTLGSAKQAATNWAGANEDTAGRAYAAGVTAAAATATGVTGVAVSQFMPESVRQSGGKIVGGSAKFLSRAAPVATVGLGAYDVYSAATDDKLTSEQKKIKYGRAGGATAGALAGGAAGAAAGSFVPVLGNAVGGILGGLIGGAAGYFGGGAAGENIAKDLIENSKRHTKVVETQEQTQQQMLKSLQSIERFMAANPTWNLNLDGSLLYQGLGQRAESEAKRNSTVQFYLQKR